MLRSKGINKISELKNGFTQRWLEPDFILGSLKNFKFSVLCKFLNPIKTKGYSFEHIFSILISLGFTGSNTINSMINGYLSKQIEAGKDVFYRLKNNPKVAWRLILWMFATKFKKIVGTDDDGIKCLIIDDTLIQKTGRYIEKVSRVWDHVSKRSLLGFKLLLLGFWDGVTFIPVDFSYHREKGKNKEKPFGLKKKELKKQFKKKREKGTCSHERELEADMDKISVGIKMFKRAISQGFKANFLLMDSWFTCEAFIDAVLGVKKYTLHLIGMYKIAKTNFEYNGKKYTYSQLRNKLGKVKRCRKLRLHYKEAVVMYNGKQVKLFFSRQGRRGKWKTFITTDTGLSFIKMVEIYQTRWSIEVFFKEAKQLLGLSKCQSSDFDAQIADATITMVQFILLSLKYRYEKYESKGKLYEKLEAAIVELRLNERLWGLFIELLHLINKMFNGADESELIETLINDEQVYAEISRLLTPFSENQAA
jgi:hypothetical protein